MRRLGEARGEQGRRSGSTAICRRAEASRLDSAVVMQSIAVSTLVIPHGRRVAQGQESCAHHEVFLSQCYKICRMQYWTMRVGWGVPSSRLFEGIFADVFPRAPLTFHAGPGGKNENVEQICAGEFWRLGVACLTGCDRHSNKEVFYLVRRIRPCRTGKRPRPVSISAAAQFKVTAKVVGPAELRSAS